jgi:trigger factor
VKVTREKTEKSQVFLTIEMEAAEVEESLEQSYHRLVRKASIPGFRKGKAPRAIVERYLGRDSLFEDAVNHLLPEAYEKAVKEQEIEAIAEPQIEIAQTEPLVFKATIPVKPTVKLGDYRSLQLTAEPVLLSDDDVNAVIEQLRHRYAAWEPVERPVDFGDLVTLDVDSTIDDAPFITRKQAPFRVLRDLPFPAPGFAEQLTGLKPGEEKEFKLEFPSDYPRRELAGKQAAFVVRVIEVKQEKLPEINDEFARQVNPEWENLETLCKQVTADLKLKAEERARMDFEERVVEAVVELSQVEFPSVLVEDEINRLLDEQSRRWQTGEQGLEEYLRSVNKTEAELREELRPLAAKRVGQLLVLGKVAAEENVEVTDAEVDAEIENLTSGAGESKDEMGKLLSTPESRESVKRYLTRRKTIQRLAEIAQSSQPQATGGAEAETKE